MGHVTGGGASGGLLLSNEQLGKLRRYRAIGKHRRTINAGPRARLSLGSRGLDRRQLALVGDLRGWLFGSNDELPLGFDAGGALILPVADEPAGREGQQEERDG